MSTRLKEWVVTLEPGADARGLEPALAGAGLAIEQVLVEIGVITGRGAARLGPALRRLQGVADVSEGAPIDIGPPGRSPT